jgi:hypothetical protein
MLRKVITRKRKAAIYGGIITVAEKITKNLKTLTTYLKKEQKRK